MYHSFASTGHRIYWGTSTNDDQFVPSLGAGDRQWLFMAWVRPTTLTAGRYLLSFGSPTTQVKIHTTTDELRLVQAAVTTSPEWTTDGVNLAVNTDTFIAVYQSVLDKDNIAWWVWRGDLNTGLVDCTVTQAISVNGALYSGGTAFLGGNNVSSNAWQGLIGDALLIRVGLITGGDGQAHTVFGQPLGSIDQAGADFLRARFVEPVFYGRDISDLLRTNDAEAGSYTPRVNVEQLVHGRSSLVWCNVRQPAGAAVQYYNPYLATTLGANGLDATREPVQPAPLRPNWKYIPPRFRCGR